MRTANSAERFTVIVHMMTVNAPPRPVGTLIVAAIIIIQVTLNARIMCGRSSSACATCLLHMDMIQRHQSSMDTTFCLPTADGYLQVRSDSCQDLR